MTGYKDKETLKSHIQDQDMTYAQISDKYDVTERTIKRWAKRHDVNPGLRVGYASFKTEKCGYERWSTSVKRDDGTWSVDTFRVHRLLAVAIYGIDAVKDNVTHHNNGLKWANWHWNIEVLTPGEHVRVHEDELAQARRESGMYDR